MKDLKWKVETSAVLHADKWLSIRTEKCVNPQGQVIEPYYVIDYPNWTNALALTVDQQVILVRIYRHGLEQTILEIPGGNMDAADATPEATIRRELLEETGYVFDHVEQVHRISPNPANHSNLAYGFLMTGGRKVAEQNLDEDEQLEVVLVSLAELRRMLRANEIWQAMHVTTIFYGLQALENDES